MNQKTTNGLCVTGMGTISREAFGLISELSATSIPFTDITSVHQDWTNY